MNLFLQVILAVAVYTMYMVSSRYFEFASPIADWFFLVVCSLMPVAFHKSMKNSVVRTVSLVMLNAVILFFDSFWLIEFIFKDGL
ncbi:hypothetical protein [Microbulbifer sp. TYP-18]|uniref:hypothetical protein n=1 Tax=Microbulbifer sp. TYP-18 TaxID=3230024 RepID=UPI0034C6DEB3